MIVGEDGDVETGHCDCKAGLDECCSHIAAILFALLSVVKILSETTCTSLPNAWYGSSGGKAEMLESSHISFIKPKRQMDRLLETGELLQPTSMKARDLPTPTKPELSEFHDIIKPLGKCALLSVLPQSAADFQPRMQQLGLPEPLSELFKEDNMSLEKDDLLIQAHNILPSITVSEEEVGNHIYELDECKFASCSYTNALPII